MRHEIISPQHQQIIDLAMRASFGDVIWKVEKHQALGASAQIYIVTCEDQKLVVRLSDKSRPGANIPLEYTAIQQASDCGVAPHVYYQNADQAVCIMQYIDSTPLQYSDQLQLNDATTLGKTIAKLHQSDTLPESATIFSMVTMMKNSLRPLFPKDQLLNECLNIFEQYQGILDHSEDRRPSHRDLHAFNILNNHGRFYFIDWEFAGNDSLFFDLAVVSNMMLFNDQVLVDALLNAYFTNGPTKQHQEKFNLMRVASLIYYGVVLMYLSTESKEPHLTSEQIDQLPDYQHYIREQIRLQKPDMSGKYLEFAYSLFKQAIILK